MKINHIAIWTNNLEELRYFYEHYFNGTSNNKYVNTTKGFESYFIRFEGDTTLEIMKRTDITEQITGEYIGICHIAFSVKNKKELIAKTEQFRNNGFEIVGEPRLTGDGFFESVILDIDKNRIELVAESIE